MTPGRARDIAATLIVALVLLVLFTTQQGWGVYLIGGSHRWAAGVTTILGATAFLLAIPSMRTAVVPFATLAIGGGGTRRASRDDGVADTTRAARGGDRGGLARHDSTACRRHDRKADPALSGRQPERNRWGRFGAPSGPGRVSG